MKSMKETGSSRSPGGGTPCNRLYGEGVPYSAKLEVYPGKRVGISRVEV